MRDQLGELEQAAKVGGGCAEHSYKKFIELLRDGVMQMGTYSPIEIADVKQVMKTIVDPTCTAWRKKMKGVHTGNCRTIMHAEEKKEKVLRAAENKEIPENPDIVLGEDSLEGKTPEEQRDIRLTIKRFFQHVQHVHEEASCAAGKLAELVDVLDPEEFGVIARVGTHLIVAVEFSEVKQLVEAKKEETKKAEMREELKNMNIEDIVAIQNLPTPLDHWKNSKILLPTHYLAAATHYFIYSQAVQDVPMTNKFVAKKFNISLSTLHHITSGRKYAGGHESQRGQKGDHGEVMVKIAKTKEKGKVQVAKVPTMAAVELDDSTLSQGTRKQRWSKGEEKPEED